MKPVRVALAGCGYFSQFHIDAWRRIDGATLAAVCDVDPDRLRAVAGDTLETFEDAATMIDTVRPDLVDIATPPATHLNLVRLCAKRGIDAICQKPLAPAIEDAREIVRVARNASITLIVHENFRFQPWYREARRLIDGGVLGRLHGAFFRLRPGDGQGADAYLARQPYFQKMERFLVHETGIHFIDTFRYLLGEPVAVSACLRRLNPAIAGEDAGFFMFRFDDGRTALFDGNRLNDHVAVNPRLTMGEMWLEGAKGVLRLDGDGRLFLKPHQEPEREHEYAWADRGFAGDCVQALQAHVIQALSGARPFENLAADYLRNVEIEEAVYRADAERREVAL